MTFDQFLALVQALSGYAWPSVALVAIFVFKRELSRLLARVRKGKFGENEIEFGEEIKELAKSAELVETETIPHNQLTSTSSTENDDRSETFVLQQAAISPDLGMLALWRIIEREIWELMVMGGHHPSSKDNVSMPVALNYLGRNAAVSKNLIESLKLFKDTRNKIVHEGVGQRKDITRVIDIGITILRGLRAVPREINVCFHPGVPIYGDESCTNQLEGLGVILETTSPGGAEKTHRIFPSTKLWFVKGKRVSWEWSDSKRWGDAWYKDPDTQAVQKAWGASMEFVGRPLD